MSTIALMVQTRMGTREHVMRAELLNLDGVVLIAETPLGAVGERVLLDVIIEDSGYDDTVPVVASVVSWFPNIGTKVRFELAESEPGTLERLRRYIERFGLLAPTSDYPLTVLAPVA